jgi:hypothetical protein
MRVHVHLQGDTVAIVSHLQASSTMHYIKGLSTHLFSPLVLERDVVEPTVFRYRPERTSYIVDLRIIGASKLTYSESKTTWGKS